MVPKAETDDAVHFTAGGMTIPTNVYNVGPVGDCLCVCGRIPRSLQTRCSKVLLCLCLGQRYTLPEGTS